ncbi:hypothetical protein WS71_28185 [Burkholderia mayonis]|uniref:YiiM-like triple helical domain-containing protein n=1 Tax=Burkholderia mayonis TaxID=1385591 RepID=A0A1B4G513_9BURK|nr:hypothetical protein WS71_28185 [Burkholderia mayonis]KVE49606.1 hypothetical protein WS71_16020 [Burkholderia mayonis]
MSGSAHVHSTNAKLDALLIGAIRPLADTPHSSVLDVLYRRTLDAGTLEALSGIDALPPSWRQLFERRLKAGAVEDWTKRLDG